MNPDLNAVLKLTWEQLDELPYGLLIVDHAGIVREINRFELREAGRSEEQIIGKNFFEEIAVCSRVTDLYGVFKQGVAR